ncbi:MAG: histone deacetylase [Acidobacteriota bacterium]
MPGSRPATQQTPPWRAKPRQADPRRTELRRPVLRRTYRRFWRLLRRPAFRLVYHERYNAAFPGVPNDPLRAERILAFLASEGLVLRRCVNRPEPVWLKTLERVHGTEYLDSIHRTATLTSIMGIEVTADQVDRLIDFQRLQTGGTLMATRRAREFGIGVNLGGGLHHALANQGGGYCIFNDVAVAIADERRKGFDGPILVIDLDLHDGDGTRDIFRQDPDVYTFSIHARHWGSTDAVASRSVELGSRVDDATYLAAVREHLPPVVREVEPRLVFYLAGCDPARDDQLGDWKISPLAMLERDRLVMRELRRGGRRPSTVILLAGGYSAATWRYSARFLSDVHRPGRPIEPPSTEEITLKRYRYLFRHLDPAELSGSGSEDNFGITEDDLYLPGWGVTPETRFLGFFTKHGIELLFERSGFLDRLRDLGFAHPTIVLQLEDPSDQTLRIFGGPDRSELLVELRLRRDRRTLAGLDLLSIEWLLMQNPHAQFAAEHEVASPQSAARAAPNRRPQLPGQSHPGLGMLNDIAAMLQVICERLHLDGLVFVPSQYHVAAYGHGYLSFVDPVARARFAALRELFQHTPLPEATRLVAEGGVIDADTGETFRWQPTPMVLEISKRLARQLREADDSAPTFRFEFRELPDDSPP